MLNTLITFRKTFQIASSVLNTTRDTEICLVLDMLNFNWIGWSIWIFNVSFWMLLILSNFGFGGFDNRAMVFTFFDNFDAFWWHDKSKPFLKITHFNHRNFNVEWKSDESLISFWKRSNMRTTPFIEFFNGFQSTEFWFLQIFKLQITYT